MISVVGLSLATLLCAAASDPQSPEYLPDRKETFGAVIGPATLPSASTAVYGFIGVPEIGAGFRQGFGLPEIELRAKINYLTLSLTAEALVKLGLVHQGYLDVAPYVGIGGVANSGARFFDPNAYPYLGIRGIVGAVATYRVTEIFRAIALLDAPFDYVVPTSGSGRFLPQVGGGAEVYLGSDVTGSILGQLGPAIGFQPGGTQVSLGYLIRIGVGFRLF